MQTALEIAGVFQAPKRQDLTHFLKSPFWLLNGGKSSGKVICETGVLGEDGIMENSEMKQRLYFVDEDKIG